MITLCPACGHSLASLEAFRVGELFIDKGGAFVWWRSHVVPLTTSERLMVIALARADGNPIRHDILSETVGSDSENPVDVVNVFLTRARAKFRAVDPEFDNIETVRGAGVRWRQ